MGLAGWLFHRSPPRFCGLTPSCCGLSIHVIPHQSRSLRAGVCVWARPSVAGLLARSSCGQGRSLLEKGSQSLLDILEIRQKHLSIYQQAACIATHDLCFHCLPQSRSC
ncbi:hypothetical protein CHARACLAT_012684 [Characodon lateralis]|uniref:Uncharacterized protein n=1 Tax=Characodon lateralis TaxID=208331 RepID=A0ABU7E027_9TELE|nr:hypothetical protein [Characodon lateralis]